MIENEIFLSVTLVVCVLSFVFMWIGYARFHKVWNIKTRDYWYGRVAWSSAGIFLCLEQLARKFPFNYAMVFVLAGALITLKGNMRPGPWGTNTADDQNLR